MGRLATDIGGTFTDLVYFDEATGRLSVAKSLTTPNDLTQGIADTIAQADLDTDAVDFFVHGGTTVINAITERKGVKTALVTTAGFRDVLEIARGNRPDLYNLRFRKETAFVPRALRFEVRERVDAKGNVLLPIELSDLDAVAASCKAAGVEAIAVLFLHSYVAPEHEVAAAERLRALLPGVPVTASHEITREWREYERTNTAVLNAYVQPIIQRYFDRLSTRLESLGCKGPYFAMQSNGGTTSFEWAKEHPITLIESGPAAGVNGAALVSELVAEPNVIYLDIGGTTAKCSTIQDGVAGITTEYKLEWTRTSFGYPVRTPVVDIVEIGAGGGSIAWFDPSGALRVGPVSAGADPGPACYGRGGTLPTVTDAKLITGVINPEYFAVGKFGLDRDKARAALQPIADRLGISVEEAAVSILRVVDASMINALKLISIQRGHDPRDFALVVGGGGGPMHAAVLGRELGVKEVVIPLYPGLFSAWGMLATEPRRDFVRTRLTLAGATTIGDVAELFGALEEEAVDYFRRDAGASGDVTASFSCDLRYLGQEHAVTVPVDLATATIDSILADFHAAHEKTYTFRLPDTPVEFVTYRLKARARAPRPEIRPLDNAGRSGEAALKGHRTVDFGEEGVQRAAIYERDLLPSGFVALGPMIVEEPTSTTMVLPGQQLRVDELGFLRITEPNA
ncbi:MAG: hydantoinase/oxoprolinase family protein [Rhizobiales bacterium]|nr:hydantoinase/oxoprolinase family protein [Hyphomicrobiales bacterium]